MKDKSLIQIAIGLSLVVIALVLPICFYLFDVNKWLLGILDVVLGMIGYIILNGGFYEDD